MLMIWYSKPTFIAVQVDYTQDYPNDYNKSG